MRGMEVGARRQRCGRKGEWGAARREEGRAGRPERGVEEDLLIIVAEADLGGGPPAVHRGLLVYNHICRDTNPADSALHEP